MNSTPMTWEQYRELALKTESIPQIIYLSIHPDPRTDYLHEIFNDPETMRATRLMHAAAGLVTETDELLHATNATNLLEEVGDCFWYLPIIYQILGTTPEPDTGKFYAGPNECLMTMATAAAALTDQCIKRHIIYGKELDSEVVDNATQEYIDALDAYCTMQDLEPAKIWEANIEKLRKRYPDGRFDVVATSNRDVENELSHIPTTVLEAKANNWEAIPMAPTAEEVWFNGPKAYDEDSSITPLMLQEAMCQHFTPLNVLELFADWALRIANGYRAAGADCMAEGFKEVFIKIQAVKGDTAQAKAMAVMKDGWMLFQTLPDHPTTAKELQAWLTKSS